MYIYVTSYVIKNNLMDFFNRTGKMAIGSRLRMLTDKITEDSTRIYQSYGIDMQPKWFPVFYILSSGEARTNTSIAREIGHTHPSVSKIIREMAKKGYVHEKKDKSDGRRNMVTLSPEGKEIASRIQEQYVDVTAAINEISSQSRNDLWQAIGEWEFLLDQKSIFKRVEEQRKSRLSSGVTIVPFQKKYAKAFRDLNEAWISQYFTMEEADYKALDNPQSYIIDKGGFILIALHEDQPVGTCAMIKMDDPEYDYELAKMAVSPSVQGRNIGYLLGKAVLEQAKAFGAKKVYLESNTILKPAISLYQKLGFQKVVGHTTPYERCNIQMGVTL